MEFPSKEEIKAWHVEAFDSVMKEKLVPIIGQETASQVEKLVQKLQLQRAAFNGKDMTGLDAGQKGLFVDTVRRAIGF
jgi:hypothetical protein